ncbi:hypothetical protein ACVSXV_22565 [Yersinia enterocolitica]|uniref:hypothetical protein n=1 Tax=Yersinia enterocolitica TaxID=630 RepID=UPI0005DE13CC|nr:hypothetical protein [Yersinia enterocolitica]CNL89534.1 phage protein [Yersinia enterocolitica]HEI6819403.1 hypothetical protein [Yersinia enterocolitica]
MQFKDLPVSVQNIAAQWLADKLPTAIVDKEPALKLAQSIRDCFIELYSAQEAYLDTVKVDLNHCLKHLKESLYQLEQINDPKQKLAALKALLDFIQTELE